MNYIDAIILGLIQGLTEFLPVSSTAHLTLAGKIMGIIDPSRPEDWTAAIAIIQLGTVAAVIVYFLRDLMDIICSFIKDLFKRGSGERWTYESKLAGKIILGTIPVAVTGLIFKDIIEGTFTKEISTIATSLIALALLLWWAEKTGKHTRTDSQTKWKDAFVIGCAQALALIPGSSRSGTTITAGLFMGLTRETAARFSFLLSVPAVLASGFYEMYKARDQITEIGIPALALSTVVSGIVGYATIAFLLKYLRTHTTYGFIAYRLALGLILWGMLILRAV